MRRRREKRTYRMKEEEKWRKRSSKKKERGGRGRDIKKERFTHCKLFPKNTKDLHKNSLIRSSPYRAPLMLPSLMSAPAELVH